MLEKRLVKNEKEYILFAMSEILKWKWYSRVVELVDLGGLLGTRVTFADEPRKGYVSADEVDRLNFKSKNDFPKSYPCVALIGKWSDPHGDSYWETNFVYPNDFEEVL